MTGEGYAVSAFLIERFSKGDEKLFLGARVLAGITLMIGLVNAIL